MRFNAGGKGAVLVVEVVTSDDNQVFDLRHQCLVHVVQPGQCIHLLGISSAKHD